MLLEKGWEETVRGQRAPGCHPQIDCRSRQSPETVVTCRTFLKLNNSRGTDYLIKKIKSNKTHKCCLHFEGLSVPTRLFWLVLISLSILRAPLHRTSELFAQLYHISSLTLWINLTLIPEGVIMGSATHSFYEEVHVAEEENYANKYIHFDFET